MNWGLPGTLRLRVVPYTIRDISGLMDLSYLKLGPGIYFLCVHKTVIYVGQSIMPVQRIATHHKEGRVFDGVFYFPCPKEKLDAMESALIRFVKPAQNYRCSIKDLGTDNELLKTIWKNKGGPR